MLIPMQGCQSLGGRPADFDHCEAEFDGGRMKVIRSNLVRGTSLVPSKGASNAGRLLFGANTEGSRASSSREILQRAVKSKYCFELSLAATLIAQGNEKSQNLCDPNTRYRGHGLWPRPTFVLHIYHLRPRLPPRSLLTASL